MARPKKHNPTQEAQASVGHNSGKVPLTEEEAAALTTHYALKVIAQQKVVAQKQAELDGERSQVNGFFKMISKDLGITRKDFEADVIAVLGMTEAEYLRSERKRDRLHRLAGVKSGEQLSLIDVIADTADEAAAAFADGYRAGRRADDPIPPKETASILHPDWMKGWHEGQTYNGMQLAMASELLARPKPGEMAAAPEEPAEPDEETALDAEVKRLEQSGWAEPTAAEADFDQAAA